MSGDSDIRKFLETYKITFPVGKDNGLARSLGARGLPVTVFIARDGRIVSRHIGAITREELASNIEAILK